ncbi:MAG TPA: response regulator transcription factor [Acidobacteria bacterium]|nr:response regulator transcription factor [Acidobacteriota bacterium]
MDDQANIRIALIEDSPRYRATMERFIRHSPRLELVASFGQAAPALEAARRAVEADGKPKWDVVLMDIEMPGINGIEATRRLKQLCPQLKVLVLTVFEASETILQAICAGADGYLLKRARAGEVSGAIRAVIGGGAPLTPRVARSLLDVVRMQRPHDSGQSAQPTRLELTEREQQVLRGLVEGLSYQQVADTLGIGLGTVRKHITAIYRKLHVHSAAEAVSRALREQIL